MSLPEIVRLRANVVEHYGFETIVKPFHGLAFISPITKDWCGLRMGLVLACYEGDELIVISKRPVRASWQAALQARLPKWLFDHQIRQLTAA